VSDLEAIIKDGMLLFDDDVKKNGQTHACAKVDAVIEKLEENR
jgi:hypothetical protein